MLQRKHLLYTPNTRSYATHKASYQKHSYMLHQTHLYMLRLTHIKKQPTFVRYGNMPLYMLHKKQYVIFTRILLYTSLKAHVFPKSKTLMFDISKTLH